MEKLQNDLETCKSNIERWRIRKLIKELEPAYFFGLISIIIPPMKTMSSVTEWLANHKIRMLSDLESGSELFKVLNDLVEYPDDKYGFIIMDDERTLFGKLKGNRSHVIRKISVEGSGHYHVKKAEKLAKEFFKGLVLNDLSDLREKKLLDKYLKEIVDGPENGTYGAEDTITALEERAAETLIVCDSLYIIRYVFKDINTDETVVKYSKEGELLCRVYGGIGAIIRGPDSLCLNLYAFNLAKRLRTSALTCPKAGPDDLHNHFLVKLVLRSPSRLAPIKLVLLSTLPILLILHFLS
ncbi:hypothetical protein ACFX15_020222 [Malus domestica]